MDGIIEELSQFGPKLGSEQTDGLSGHQRLQPDKCKNKWKSRAGNQPLFPDQFPVYLLATYQRKLLRHDIKMVQKTSYELIDIIEKLPVSL